MKKTNIFTIKYLRFFLVFIISVLLTYPTYSQDTIQKIDSRPYNLLYLELAGNGVLYSFNYERMITDFLSVRAGYSKLHFSFIFTDVEADLFPVLVNFIFGKENFKYHVGAGLVFATNTKYSFLGLHGEGSNNKIFTLSAGFRYQPNDGGLFSQLTYVAFAKGNDFKSSIGVSIGTCF